MALVDERCKSCAYSKYFTKQSKWFQLYCDYLLMTKSKRPCEAGENCTVYKERRKKAKRGSN